jgi:hypothetical protein
LSIFWQNTAADHKRWEEIVLDEGMITISSDDDDERDVQIIEEDTTNSSKQQIITGEYDIYACKKSLC